MSIATQMAAVIDRWRSTAINVPSHQFHQLSGHPVAWWFNTQNASTRQFMQSLASDSAYVTPGNPDTSRIVIVFLRADRPMGRTLAGDLAVIRQWIAEGAPTQFETPDVDEGPARATQPPDYQGINTDLMPEYFYKLVNIEQNPNFLPYAKQLASDFFEGADFEADPNGYYREFEYTPEALDNRLKQIYDAFVGQMDEVHWLDSGIVSYPVQVGIEANGEPITRSKDFNTGSPFSNKAQKERLRQGAPFNLVDGAWLQRIQAAGPADEIRAHLFEIWDDEAGNGKVQQNHCNVYDALMRSIGFYLPPITSKEFGAADFLPGAFHGSVFQLCVGIFPEEFFPELLGMTLYLEWEATPTLTPVVRRLRSRKIDPHFYALHVAIDNITAGHGFLAKKAVKLFLEKQETEVGVAEVQKLWKRIWRGYVTWATLGGLGLELLDQALAIDLKQIDLSYAKEITEPVLLRLPELHARLNAASPSAPSAYLLSKLRPAGKAVILSPLNSASQAAITKALLAELNVFIQDDKDFYEEERFEGVVLGADVIALLATNPSGEGLVELNRLLLRDAYPGIIAGIPATTTPKPWPDYRAYFRSRMEALVSSKAYAAKPIHKGKMLGGRDLGDLFDSPSELVDLLAQSPLINTAHPRDSRFFELTDFSGPMYKIFTDREKDVILDWIESLGPKAPPTPPITVDPQHAALAMKRFIETHASRAKLVSSHAGISFPDESGAPVGLVQWFDNPTGLMAAVKRAPGWVVPGNPASSILMQKFLGPMSGLGNEIIETVRVWIQTGAEVPLRDSEPKAGRTAAALDVEKQSLSDADAIAGRNFAKKRQFIGMGAVH